MAYFPDCYYKKVPPKKYFWKVMSVIEKDVFDREYKDALLRIKKKIKKEREIILKQEHKELMKLEREENFSLLYSLQKTGVEKNIRYLKKAKTQKQSRQSMEPYIEKQTKNDKT